jgi:C-terminal processing protease CtpA/Prc
MQDRPIVSDEWREYEIIGDVADDAQAIFLGAFLFGEGRAWIDDVSLEVLGERDRTVPVPLTNAGFEGEALGGVPKSWMFPRRPGISKYAVQVSEENPRSGRRCALITGAESKAEEQIPDPAQPFSADLGGGVSCLVPLALYLDEQGTLPRADPPPAQPGLPVSGIYCSTRLAAVALAWNVFQHFYPYFDVVQADWPGALRRALTRAAKDVDDVAFLGTLRRLVAELRDGHGSVALPGMRVFKPPFSWRWIQGQLVVTRVMQDQGLTLKVGDIVQKIDGKTAAEALTETEQFASGSTPQHRRIRAWRKQLSGPQDSVMELEVQPVSGEKYVTKVRRTVLATQFREELRGQKLREIRTGIYYVDLRSMNNEEFEAATAKLAQAEGIIFDLRGYPRVRPTTIGHLIDKPVTCARWNVPITMYPDRRNVNFHFSNWTVEPKAPRFHANVAFMTDGRAISYAETYLGIIEHYKLAEIVGGPTAGTNGNVNPFTLPGGYRVRWTGMKVLKHDGSQHHGVGIQPTVRVSPTIQGVIEGRDEVLERAIEVVTR